MQHGMYGQKTDFPFQGVAIDFCLFHGSFQGDDHIAQQGAAGYFIDIVFAVASERKREHIGDTIFVAVDFI